MDNEIYRLLEILMAQRNSEKVCGRKITMDKRLEVAIEQLRQGQQQGFQILYDQTHNYVFMQARTLLKNEADVHDLVQEVYINAYRSISSLQENQKIYAWLGGIAFRQATKILRKQKEIPIGEEDMPLEPMVAFDEDIQPEHALDKKESAQILRELLEELPELQKAALMAYYYNEMSIGEIAQAFSCSEGTIKSRLNYARKSLKKAIQEREKRDNIRLHSFSLPLLLLAFGNYADECVMAEQMVNGIFQHICQRLGTLSAAASPAGSGHANASPLDPSKMASGRAARYGIHKAAGKAGIAKILAITAAIGVVAVGAGSAGYHLLYGKSFAAGQEQFIPELAVAMPAFSARLQDVIKEMDGIEETAAKAREEAEREAKRHVNYGEYTTDADTTLLLAALIQCEAGGESYEGQVAVGAVVMNRVRSAAYPDSIHGVIYASGQFTPALNGKVNRVYESGRIKESCIQAAQEALSGVSNVGDLTHFRRNNGREGLVIGNHVFY